jgi:hypothetical protein
MLLLVRNSCRWDVAASVIGATVQRYTLDTATNVLLPFRLRKSDRSFLGVLASKQATRNLDDIVIFDRHHWRSRPMSEAQNTIVVRANVEMTAASLEAIVANAKQVLGPDEKGVYRIDTADQVSAMISRFLLENDFEGFVKDITNYRR